MINNQSQVREFLDVSWVKPKSKIFQVVLCFSVLPTWQGTHPEAPKVDVNEKSQRGFFCTQAPYCLNLSFLNNDEDYSPHICKLCLMIIIPPKNYMSPKESKIMFKQVLRPGIFFPEIATFHERNWCLDF